MQFLKEDFLGFLEVGETMPPRHQDYQNLRRIDYASADKQKRDGG